MSSTGELIWGVDVDNLIRPLRGRNESLSGLVVCPRCKTSVRWLVKPKGGQEVCEDCLDELEGFR